jgi:hypothetical protein
MNNRSRVVQGTVNDVIEWRVYFDGEVIWKFDQYKDAILLRDFLNANFL